MPTDCTERSRAFTCAERAAIKPTLIGVVPNPRVRGPGLTDGVLFVDVLKLVKGSSRERRIPWERLGVCILDTNHPAFRSGNVSAEKEEILLYVDSVNLEVFHCDAFVSQVPRHFFAFEDFSRLLTLAR